MSRIWSVLLIFGLLISPAFSATPRKYSNHKIYRKRAAKPRVQQHYSFIPASKPSETLARLKEPLQGRVVEQQLEAVPTLPVAPPIRPKYTQIFLSPAELEALTHPQPVQVVKHTRKFKLKKEKAPRVASIKRKVDYEARSWVSDINTAQASQLAESIAGFFAGQYPPTSTTLLLAIPKKKSQAHNPFTSELTASLRQAGFALVDSISQAPDAQIVRYQVSALNEGLWVQIHINNKQINRFYKLNGPQGILATSPFSVREEN